MNGNIKKLFKQIVMLFYVVYFILFFLIKNVEDEVKVLLLFISYVQTWYCLYHILESKVVSGLSLDESGEFPVVNMSSLNAHCSEIQSDSATKRWKSWAEQVAETSTFPLKAVVLYFWCQVFARTKILCN